MKRMNEVFELPLTVPVGTDDELIDDKCVSVGELVSRNYAKHAAHAINHVDALADALEAMIKSHDLVGGAPSGYYAVLANAKSALEAYRGTI